MPTRKKLIEVALPLEKINVASAREKSIRHGHPSTLHLWWARRPLAAARAVIFAQMVDDPSSWPELFPTEVAQEAERQRLFRLIEQLVLWENTTNEDVLQQARDEIWKSWRRTCAAERQEIAARKEEIGSDEYARRLVLFDPDRLPAFHDPFAGGGAIPLEAQRLGLESYASDLNPVAVLINKAMIEIPPKFAGQPPVNPESRSKYGGKRKEQAAALPGTRGVAEGDGSGTADLPVNPQVATRGDLWDALSDDPGRSVGSGKYRGGLDTGVAQRKSAVSSDSTGFFGRDRDATDPVRADRLVSAQRDDDDPRADGRGQPDADDNAPQSEERARKNEEVVDGNVGGPVAQSSFLPPRSWPGAQGLAADVRYYGQWMRDEAEQRIGHLYPKIEVTAAMAQERPDLKPYVGKKLTVIAWLWARTVKSPNPAFRHVDVPLASTFMLSTKPGKEAYVEPVLVNRIEERGTSNSDLNPQSASLTSPAGYRFTIRVGKPKNAEAAKNGTKLSRGSNFRCLMSETPIAGDYIKAEGLAGRMGARLMAIVAEGERGRVYLAPTPEHEAIALQAKPEWQPDVAMPDNPRWFSPPFYGLKTFGDLFTPRQLVALNTFADLVQEARELVRCDALAAGMRDDGCGLNAGGSGATAYAEAVGVYLAFAISRSVDRGSNICSWDNSPKMEALRNTFGRQAIPMVWDFAEGNPLSESSGSWMNNVEWGVKTVFLMPAITKSAVFQCDATTQTITQNKIISTDPPYYDNIGYADLSDFFYVWLRRTLRPVFPDLFATLAVPKAEELVATPYRHGGKEQAEKFFLDGMTQTMQRLAEQTHPAFPVTIYYAFKQSETDGKDGTSSTGWETFLDAVIRAGFAVSGTWPMRTELSNRMISSGTNALASSIVLVCRPRPKDAPTVTRRDFVAALKAELPLALANMQRGNIAPVDLAQASIGPGMGVFTRYGKVIDATGKMLSVREALALINATLDEVLAEQEGDFDAETRWAVTWFDQHGFAEGEYGVAETLATARNTSVSGMAQAGILASKGGKVRLLRPEELPADWNPNEGKKRGESNEQRANGVLSAQSSLLSAQSSLLSAQITTWEMVHHLVRVLNQGEQAAADLVAKLGPRADVARELAYRLYAICERKKRAAEALAYNGLVQSWPEMLRLASERRSEAPVQQGMEL